MPPSVGADRRERLIGVARDVYISRMSDEFTVQALVVSQALPLRVERLTGDLVPEGLSEGALCLGLFAEQQLLSRFASTPEEEAMITELGLFAEPRRLLLYGMVYPPGVQTRLVALIPDTLFPKTAEPWEAASQSYEESVEAEPEGPLADVFAGVRQLPVGDLVRYESLRKYPDDLAAELADILASAAQLGAQDIVDHALAAMEQEFGEDSASEDGLEGGQGPVDGSDL
jgi:hypothetical protein